MWAQWRDFVLFHVLYDTALRISEAISLDCNDIVRRQIVLPANKAKERCYRIIPITNHTLKLLIKLIDENKEVFNNHEKHHRAPVANFGGTERFLKDQENDKLKEWLVRENGIKLLRVSSKEKWVDTDYLRMVLEGVLDKKL